MERAEILLTAEISSGEDYGRYPNFSKALREELQATVSAAARSRNSVRSSLRTVSRAEAQ